MTPPSIESLVKEGIIVDYDLLTYIDEIDQCVYETQISVCESMSNVYLKQSNMLACLPDESIIQEGVGKKILGGLKNIWKFICNIFKWIGTMIVKFISWISRLFKKKTKSADQIVVEVLGIKQRQIQESVEQLPAADNSEIKNEKVDRIFNDLIVFIDTIGGWIRIDTVEDYNPNVSKGRQFSPTLWTNHVDMDNADLFMADKFGTIRDPKYGMIKGMNYPQIPGQQHERTPAYALHILTNPDALDTIQDIVDSFKRVTQSGMSEIVSNGLYKNIKQKILTYKEHGFHFKYGAPIKYDMIRTVQSKISQITHSVSDIAIDKLDDSAECKSASADLLSLMTNIQMSFNALTGLFSVLWRVNPAFDNSFDNVEQASLFVKSCIKSGIPPKYIRQNLWYLCQPTVKGEGGNLPVWGQTRAVFFPSNTEFVYKIALSGAGISANKMEYVISKRMEQSKLDNFIALTESEYSDYAIIQQEKCPNDSKTKSERVAIADALKNAIREKLDEAGFPIRIDNDIHYNNIGFSKRVNDWVAIDYGWIQSK